ncbi:anthranilate synthase component I [Leucobacter massiliensis]|uniref:Anthranilate synthase component 1 n=1 Tax=Leucobacter massiliensis TaxID=1686285 RepID=A0A2S9QQA0_9MICO|nr:anthranilate synthase component I [Leucobacter massiliensis]PRI11758.1 anthranilate synthase component I [Leucobacter massiliensis]
MTLTTSRADFERARASHAVIPVCREIFADADTPVGIYRKVAASRPGTFLLESAEQGGVWTRFSFVGAGSFGVLGEREGRAHWRPAGGSGARAGRAEVSEDRLLPGGVSSLAPVAALRAVYERWRAPQVPGLPPLASGFVGYLGWETVRQFERLEHGPQEGPGLPTQGLSFVSELVVIDHREGSVVLLANVLNDAVLDGEAPAGALPDGGSSDRPADDGAQTSGDQAAEAENADAQNADAQWAEAQARLDALQESLAAPAPSPLGGLDREALPDPVRLTSTPEFIEAVERAKRHIVDGDIFQVVPSQRFDQECSADPLDVYRVLRHLNPSPYLYLLQLEGRDGEPFAVVGSSPEALVTVQESGHVMTHPIAGSRPRGETIEEDQQHERELLADEKERAEHLMLVDLARNDLLRVCEPSSVAVTEFMRVERFSHIMHIVSTVEGQVRGDQNPVDVFRATFPAGTLSGAPKPRALEIIDELETVQRGVYGGVVGYFGLGGAADLAIAIRTATITGGVAMVQAGAGIVADSVPETEDAECRSKAAAPLRAIAIANTLQDLRDPARPGALPRGGRHAR